MNTQLKKISSQINSINKNQALDLALRFFAVVALLYLFLVGVKVLGGSFKMMGSGFAQGLLDVSANPFLALFSGMFASTSTNVTSFYMNSSITCF